MKRMYKTISVVWAIIGNSTDFGIRMGSRRKEK
jgi:hypothetical protein